MAASSSSASTSEPPRLSAQTFEEIYAQLPKKKPDTPLSDLMKEQDILDNTITNPNSGDIYRTYAAIGTSGDGAATVYRAIYTPHDLESLANKTPSDLYFAMKVIKLEPEGNFVILKDLVDKNSQLGDHPNVLGVSDQITVDGKFWVAFPFMDQGSLRCLMASCFNNGLPEELISFALQETVKGLCFLHDTRFFHRDINAGHIYFGLEIPAIKIGAFASIYEHEYNSGQPSSTLPEKTISDWAAAPEIYYNLNEGQYTGEADTWLIGITALELAYGGIRVRNRQDLEDMIGYIVKKSKYGSKKKNLVTKCVMLPPNLKNIKKYFGPSVMVNGKLMSQAFVDLVAACLNEDHEKRPDAAGLLHHDFFKNCKDVYYFQNAVRKAKR